MVRDPVCGMELEMDDADATSVFHGETYYFCCEECKQEFDRDPAYYTRQTRPGDIPIGGDLS